MTATEPTATEELVPATVDPSAAAADPWSRFWRMSKIVAGTEMVPPALRDRPEAVFALALYAESVGIHPATAWQQVAFIAGKPVPSAQLQRALILQAGHTIETLAMTATRARVRGTRTDGTSLVVTFTIEDANRAGLVKKGGAWETYPAAMLHARASSALARALFPDAIGGMSYLAEELDDGPAELPDDVIDATEEHDGGDGGDVDDAELVT
jgi:hypothetical protein